MITRRGRGRFPAIAAALLLVVGVVAGVLTMAGGSGCGIPADASCLRVLFVGNSYMSTNDLPGTFARLARSGGRRVEVASVAPGGATLSDHASSAEVVAAIAGTRWTAVVLQEQSLVPAASEMLYHRHSHSSPTRKVGAEPKLRHYRPAAALDGPGTPPLDSAHIENTGVDRDEYPSSANPETRRLVRAGMAAAANGPGSLRTERGAADSDAKADDDAADDQ